MKKIITLFIMLVSFTSFSDNEKLSLDSMSKLYESYLNKVCSDVSCVNKKKRIFASCNDWVCRDNLLSIEELVLQKCSNTNKKVQTECFNDEHNRSVLYVCSSLSCRESIISKLIQKIIVKKKISYKKVVIITESIRSDSLRQLTDKSVVNDVIEKSHSDGKPQLLYVSKKSNSLNPATKGENKEIKKEDPKLSDDTQFVIAHKAKDLYLNDCEDEGCVDKVNKAFSYLGEKNKLTEKEVNDKVANVKSETKDIDVPEEIIDIYIKYGPYSEEMFSYFKTHPDLMIGNFSLPKSLSSCSATLVPETCKWSAARLESIHKISSYFGYSKQFPNKVFTVVKKLHNQGLDIQNATYCSLSAERKLPTAKGVYNKYSGRQYGLALSFAKNARECRSKLENTHLVTLKKKLKELGDFALDYSITTRVLNNATPPIIKVYNIKGNCDAYFYTPLNTHIAPTKEALDKSPRVRMKLNYKNVTSKQCGYEASRNRFLADPSKVEEYIFFNGSVPIVRAPSKRIMEKLTDLPLQFYFTSLTSMSTACVVNAKSLTWKPPHLKTSDTGDCSKICKNDIERRMKYGGKYEDLNCSLYLEYKTMGFKRSHKYSVYKSPNYAPDATKKICKHFDYEWSKKPIFEFYAQTKEACFDAGLSITGKRITDRESYLSNNYVNRHNIRDIEFIYDGKSIMTYRSEKNSSCNASYYGGTKGYLGSLRGVLVSSKSQCRKVCEDYHKKASSMARKSFTWVLCELRTKRNSDRMLLNELFTPKGIDPFIVISPDYPISKEEVLKNYFNRTRTDSY